jgi:hypothetical protein
LFFEVFELLVFLEEDFIFLTDSRNGCPHFLQHSCVGLLLSGVSGRRVLLGLCKLILKSFILKGEGVKINQKLHVFFRNSGNSELKFFLDPGVALSHFLEFLVVFAEEF